MYETSWVGEKLNEHGALASRDKSNLVMDGEDDEAGAETKTGRSERCEVERDGEEEENKDVKGTDKEKIDGKVKKPLELPLKLELNNPMPGEPPYMRRRTFPKAIRFFKQNVDKNPHKYYLQQLIMYWPFKDQSEIFPDDPIKCEDLYDQHVTEIDNIRAKVLPFMENVQAARRIYEENKVDEESDLEEVAVMLDPEKEQEIEDVDCEDEEDHPEYLYLNPDQVEEESKEESHLM